MAAAIGLQTAGAVSGAASAREQGVAQKNYYYYLAKQNEVQADQTLKAGNEQTSLIQDQGAFETGQLRKNERQTMGAQRAAAAASGIGAGSATLEDIARDTMTKADLDAAAIRYNADAKSWETQTTARNTAASLRAGATGYRYAGDNAITAGNINANASLLGGATSVANTWANWSQTSRGRTA